MTREEKVDALVRFIEALEDEWGISSREMFAEHIQIFVESGYDLIEYEVEDV